MNILVPYSFYINILYYVYHPCLFFNFKEIAGSCATIYTPTSNLSTHQEDVC